MYILDTSSEKPLHIQLYEALKKEIIETRNVGEKLPSVRKLAADYTISKNTVESAYNQLYAEGYIESRPRRGYFVSDLLYETFPHREIPAKSRATAPRMPYRFDFYPIRHSPGTFPVKLWKRLYAKAVNDDLDFGIYPDGQGEEGLREAIAAYLRSSRAVNCTAAQVVITGAFMDTMTMIADLLRPTGMGFAVEHPGYYVARQSFEHFGYDVTPIQVDEHGLDVETLEASDAGIVYITPSHQYPTGATMPVARRLRLLNWAKMRQGYIIEDDYDSELTYRSRPVPSLQGLDADDRVIYVGTFAKALSPALRVGYMVLPYRLREAYRRFHVNFARVSLTTQKTLELFITEGHWERHLRRIRNLNRKKHDRMKDALLQHLGTRITIVSEGGGLNINIRPNMAIDLTLLEKKAQQAGIKLYFAKAYSGGEWEAIRMGFGGFSLEEIDAAVRAVAAVWDEVDRSISMRK